MKDLIRKYFISQNVEFYSVIPYEKCRVINQNIMDREDFKPKSVIMFLLPYYTGKTENISHYAASLDYHIIIKDVADGLISIIRDCYPECRARGYGDHSPIDEVNAALISGLGIIGDNGLLINETYGSYVFIGDIVTDIPPEAFGEVSLREVGHCLHCGACKRACPTGILRGEGNDCLSAITQRKGELLDFEVALMKKYNTAWGCDLCQTSCPYNRDPKKTPIEFFYKDRIECLTRDILDGMDKQAFMRRAFAWRGRKIVERNLDVLGK